MDMNESVRIGKELRERILSLAGVAEKPHAGIHEDAFFVGKTMFMHIHGSGRCDIRLPGETQKRVLAEGLARPHRWAPEAGYVTVIVRSAGDIDPAMALIRTSYEYWWNKSRTAREESPSLR
jgi:hypothetical protein